MFIIGNTTCPEGFVRRTFEQWTVQYIIKLLGIRHRVGVAN